MTEPPTRRLRLVLGLGVAAYLIIAVGTAARKSPWPDEGWLSNPAFNLLTNGRMGTPVLEPAGTGLFVLPGIERYTYWVMPLYLLVQAGWYELAGFGVFQMRLLSTAWGLIALIAWNVTLSRLLDPRKAVFAIVLLATDYTFALNASTGRMDMMSASLGALAFAAYLVVRERSLPAAILVSHSLVAASALTHPLGGLVYLPGLVFLQVSLDRGDLSRKSPMLAMLPYLLGGMAWGSYALREPSLFAAQFMANATSLNRLGIVTSPLASLLAEGRRYYTFAGMTSPEPLARSRLLLVAVYGVTVAINLVMSSMRRRRGHGQLLALIAIQSLSLVIADGRKETLYLIHTIPWVIGLVAATAYELWGMRVPRTAVGAVIVALIMLGGGGSAYLVRRNEYAESYQPAVRFLEVNAAESTLTYGSAELGIGLRFPANFRDDVYLGFLTGKRADWIAVGSSYETQFRRLAVADSPAFAHVSRLLSSEYEAVFRGRGYTIYRRTGLAD